MILDQEQEEQVREIIRQEIGGILGANLIYDGDKVVGLSFPQGEVSDDEITHAVRKEIASVAGLALRRLQDENFTRSIEGNAAAAAAKQVVGHLWGEVLAEYGTHDAES